MNDTCRNCENYRVVHDRHGFTFGPYEDNSFCQISEDPSFDDDLTDDELQAAKDGDLGWTVRCPKWSNSLK